MSWPGSVPNARHAPPLPPSPPRERSSGMYRVSAFYASTVAADLPMDMVLPVRRQPPCPLLGGWMLPAG